MKQITMDFETYEKEVQAAREDGAKVGGTMEERLCAIFKKVNSGDSHTWRQGILDFDELLGELYRNR